jgi:hypothetical protein
MCTSCAKDPGTCRDSAQNIRYLIRKYSGYPNVHFTAIETAASPGTRRMPLEKTADIATLQMNFARNCGWLRNLICSGTNI